MALLNSNTGFGYRPRKYGQRSTQAQRFTTPNYFGTSKVLSALTGDSGFRGSVDRLAERPQGAPYATARVAARPGQAPQASGRAAQGPPAAMGASPYDYSADPVLQKIRAVSMLRGHNADAQATASRKQLAIDYGDASISPHLTGDDLTATAARDNPMSVLSQLRRRYEEVEPRNLDESFNRNNLFFSGARAKGIDDLSREYQETRGDAEGRFRGMLGDVENELMQAKLMEEDELAQAEWDAYWRSLEDGSEYGWPSSGGGGYDAPAGPDVGSSLAPSAMPGASQLRDGTQDGRGNVYRNGRWVRMRGWTQAEPWEHPAAPRRRPGGIFGAGALGAAAGGAPAGRPSLFDGAALGGAAGMSPTLAALVRGRQQRLGLG